MSRSRVSPQVLDPLPQTSKAFLQPLPKAIADAVGDAVSETLEKHGIKNDLLMKLEQQNDALNEKVDGMVTVLETIWQRLQHTIVQAQASTNAESRHPSKDHISPTLEERFSNTEPGAETAEVVEHRAPNSNAPDSAVSIPSEHRLEELALAPRKEAVEPTVDERFSSLGPISQTGEKNEHRMPFSAMPDSAVSITSKHWLEKLVLEPKSVKEAVQLGLKCKEPDIQFQNPKNQHLFSTPLTQAISAGDEKMVRELLEARADPDSKYSIFAEKRDCYYESPGAVFAVKDNNVSILKLLLQYKAKLQGPTGNFVDRSGEKESWTSKPTHTLLWHACKFGKIDAVKFLLSHCSNDLETEVYDCRSDSAPYNTPLHQATASGNSKVVELLLQRRAQLSKGDLHGFGPSMRAAVDNGFSGSAAVCGILVKSSANIFAGKPRARGIDYILDMGDVQVIPAIADALASGSKEVEKLMEQMTLWDIERFVRTPGCEAIFDAIFRPTDLKEWRGNYLVILNKGRIDDKMININVAVGLHNEELKTIQRDLNETKDKTGMNDDKRSMWNVEEREDLWQFREKLLPGSQCENLHGQIHVQTARCIIPDVQNCPEILWALVRGPNAEIALAEKPGAQALVLHWWQLKIYDYRKDIVLGFLQTFVFVAFTIMLDRDVPAIYRYLLGSFSSLLWLRHLYARLMRSIGWWIMEDRNMWQVLTYEFVWQWFRVLLLGFGNLMILGAEEFKVNEVMEIRIVLGILTFFLWTTVLYAQRGLSFCMSVLPILSAIMSIRAFLFVMLWPFLGLMNCYYLLNAYSDVLKVFNIVYRMALLSDFDMEEVERVDPTYHPNEDGVIEVEDAILTQHHAAYVVFMFACTLLFAVMMMNLMVGVLSEGYNEASSNRTAICLQARASYVFEHLAQRKGAEHVMKFWLHCCGCHVGRRAEIYDRKYLWYSHPAQGFAPQEDGSILCDLMQSLSDDIAHMKHGMRLDEDTNESALLQSLSDDMAQMKESLRLDANSKECGSSQRPRDDAAQAKGSLQVTADSNEHALSPRFKELVAESNESMQDDVAQRKPKDDVAQPKEILGNDAANAKDDRGNATFMTSLS